MRDFFGFDNRVTIRGVLDRFEIRRGGNVMVWVRISDREDIRQGEIDDDNPKYSTSILSVHIGASVIDAAIMLDNAPNVESFLVVGSILNMEGYIRGTKMVMGADIRLGKEVAASRVRRSNATKDARTFAAFELVGFVKRVVAKGWKGGSVIVQTGKRPDREIAGTEGQRFYTDLALLRLPKRLADQMREDYKEKGVEHSNGGSIEQLLPEAGHVGIRGFIYGIRTDAVRSDGEEQSYYGQDFIMREIFFRSSRHAAQVTSQPIDNELVTDLG